METGKITKKEQRKQSLARERRKRRLLIGVPITLLAAAFLGAAIYRLTRPDLQGVLTFSNLLRNHDLEAEFVDAALPPTGGSHNPRWQNCGIYTDPVENSLAVHSLEHGAVWLAYRPDLSEGKIAELQDMVRGESYLLMSPFPGLQSEVVMTSWGKQLVVDALPDEGVDQFIERYKGAGPEPGAPCTDGVGQPVN
jgi:hypothetical protein